MVCAKSIYAYTLSSTLIKRYGSRPGNGTGIFAVRVPATGLSVTPLITTYQDTAERSAGTRWYNSNRRRMVMVGALVRILAAVVFLFLPFFLTKLKFLYKF